MRVKYIKYGRSYRGIDGANAHAEVSIELHPGDMDEEAFHKAKAIISRELDPGPPAPLRASIGDRMKSEGHLTNPKRTPGYMGDVAGPGCEPDVP